jgi:hypothetical protein
VFKVWIETCKLIRKEIKRHETALDGENEGRLSSLSSFRGEKRGKPPFRRWQNVNQVAFRLGKLGRHYAEIVS